MQKTTKFLIYSLPRSIKNISTIRNLSKKNKKYQVYKVSELVYNNQKFKKKTRN